jgi:Seven times multi-haem cytochrome CxxCH
MDVPRKISSHSTIIRGNTILQALGVLDPNGKPTTRLEAVKVADIARLDQASWQSQRDKMLKTCNQCHSLNFARQQLQYGDDMIRNADRLMAEAIRTVATLYQDGLLPKPQGYAYAFPDLLTFHDAPSKIEQTLFVMFFEHRMRTFQGTFHANPDYAPLVRLERNATRSDRHQGNGGRNPPDRPSPRRSTSRPNKESRAV